MIKHYIEIGLSNVIRGLHSSVVTLEIKQRIRKYNNVLTMSNLTSSTVYNMKRLTKTIYLKYSTESLTVHIAADVVPVLACERFYSIR